MSASPSALVTFVARFDPDGDFQWVLSTGVGVSDLALASDGTTWALGVYSGSPSIGGLPISPPAPEGESRAYLAAIDPAGAVTRAVGLDGPLAANDRGRPALLAASDGLIVALGNHLAKYTSDGAPIWQSPAEPGVSPSYYPTPRAVL